MALKEIREDGTFTRVGYHPNLAEMIGRKLLVDHLLTGDLGAYDAILEQQTFGKSRVDFVLTCAAQKSKTLLEVKNVVGADYPRGNVPAKRSPVGVYEYDGTATATKGGYKRSAIFPHGAHKAGIKVVSDRAIKHVHELTELHGSRDSDSYTIAAAILFVVNRGDCEYFRPCHEADMLFAQVL